MYTKRQITVRIISLNPSEATLYDNDHEFSSAIQNPSYSNHIFLNFIYISSLHI